jgi:hypothetical protein
VLERCCTWSRSPWKFQHLSVEETYLWAELLDNPLTQTACQVGYCSCIPIRGAGMLDTGDN